jgi:hypothetical protein
MMIALATLAGCASTPESHELQLRRQQIELFEECMDTALGPLPLFASADTRQKATESCRSVMDSMETRPNPAS